MGEAIGKYRMQGVWVFACIPAPDAIRKCGKGMKGGAVNGTRNRIYLLSTFVRNVWNYWKRKRLRKEG